MTIPIGPFVVILSQIKELVIRILEMFLAELSRKFGNHVTVHRPTARRSVRTTGIPIFTLTFSSYFGSPLIAHQCCDQLTAVKTRYPLTSITWPYRGLRCRPIQVENFFVVIRWRVTSFQMIAGSFLKFIWNMLCLCHYGPALLTFWFQTDLGRENSVKMQARKMLFTFLTIVTRWSRFTSNFYAIYDWS